VVEDENGNVVREQTRDTEVRTRPGYNLADAYRILTILFCVVCCR
jgi:hypothetical protein